ncbi:hypothetical protein MNJPNG_14925 [Cupriavidus oxalaticus]
MLADPEWISEMWADGVAKAAHNMHLDDNHPLPHAPAWPMEDPARRLPAGVTANKNRTPHDGSHDVRLPAGGILCVPTVPGFVPSSIDLTHCRDRKLASVQGVQLLPEVCQVVDQVRSGSPPHDLQQAHPVRI